jgi:hypothetical protein
VPAVAVLWIVIYAVLLVADFATATPWDEHPDCSVVSRAGLCQRGDLSLGLYLLVLVPAVLFWLDWRYTMYLHRRGRSRRFETGVGCGPDVGRARRPAHEAHVAAGPPEQLDALPDQSLVWGDQE